MKLKSKRYLNINVALKILLLLGFAFFFLNSVVTGSVSLYVHPRIIPYLIFAAVVMVIIALLLMGNLFNPQKHKVSLLSMVFFAIPLLMAFTLSPKSFNSSTGTVGDVQLSGGNTVSNETVKTAQSTEDQSNSEASSIESGVEDSAHEKSDESSFLQNGVIVMNSDNYYECLCELYADMDQYKGLPIEVVGFVFKENDNFADNEFVPARLMMVCCAADMQPVGLLCQYDQTSQLEADSWVKVSGTIEETEFDGETIPSIVAQKVESAEEPDEAYVYPY